MSHATRFSWIVHAIEVASRETYGTTVTFGFVPTDINRNAYVAPREHHCYVRNVFSYLLGMGKESFSEKQNCTDKIFTIVISFYSTVDNVCTFIV